MEFFSLFLIIIIIFKIKCDIIILPYIIKDLPGAKNQQKLYSYLEVGVPQQNILTELDFQNGKFYMLYNNSNIKNSSYNIFKSQTFSIISNNTSMTEFNNTYIASDSFYFYTDINCENLKLFESVPLLFPSGKNLYLSPIIGFQIENQNKSLNFINILKSKRYITNYHWTIKLKNLNEGLIIIGDLPHNYDQKNYKKNDLQFVNTYSVKNKIYWGMHISSIKFSGLTLSDNMIGRIEPKILEIIGSY